MSISEFSQFSWNFHAPFFYSDFSPVSLDCFRCRTTWKRPRTSFFKSKGLIFVLKGPLGACLDPKSLKKVDFGPNIEFLQNRAFYLHASHFWHPLRHPLGATGGLKNLTLASFWVPTRRIMQARRSIFEKPCVLPARERFWGPNGVRKDVWERSQEKKIHKKTRRSF